MNTKNRIYNILDDGDAFQLSLFLDGSQVGGAFFPVDVLGVDAAFDLAKSLGLSFATNNEAPFQGLRGGV